MKLLTWFSGYAVVSRTGDEWCLAKPAEDEPLFPVAEPPVADAACGMNADPETDLLGEQPEDPDQAGVEDGDNLDYVCPVNPKIHHTEAGSCPTCSAPLREAEIESDA